MVQNMSSSDNSSSATTASTAIPSVVTSSASTQDMFMVAFVDNFSKEIDFWCQQNFVSGFGSEGAIRPIGGKDFTCLESYLTVLLGMNLDLPENSALRDSLSSNTKIMNCLIKVVDSLNVPRCYHSNGGSVVNPLPSQAAQLIGQLASGNHAGNTATAFQNGALEALVEQILKASNPDCISKAINNLTLLKLDETSEAGLLDKEDITTIVAAMTSKHTSTSADFQAWGCSALKYIVVHDEQKSSGSPTNEKSDHDPDDEKKNVAAVNDAPAFGGFGFGSSSFGTPAPAPDQKGGSRKEKRRLKGGGRSGGSAFGYERASVDLDIGQILLQTNVVGVAGVALSSHMDNAGLNQEAIHFLHKLIEAHPSFKAPFVDKGILQILGNVLLKKTLPSDIQAAAKALIVAALFSD